MMYEVPYMYTTTLIDPRQALGAQMPPNTRLKVLWL